MPLLVEAVTCTIVVVVVVQNVPFPCNTFHVPLR